MNWLAWVVVLCAASCFWSHCVMELVLYLWKVFLWKRLILVLCGYFHLTYNLDNKVAVYGVWSDATFGSVGSVVMMKVVKNSSVGHSFQGHYVMSPLTSRSGGNSVLVTWASSSSDHFLSNLDGCSIATPDSKLESNERFPDHNEHSESELAELC